MVSDFGVRVDARNNDATHISDLAEDVVVALKYFLKRLDFGAFINNVALCFSTFIGLTYVEIDTQASVT